MTLTPWITDTAPRPLVQSSRRTRPPRSVTSADGVDLFATERVVSIDTTASGGNATLLTLSES